MEREIRLQREKEVELARQRSGPDHTPTPSELSVSSSEPVSPPLLDTPDSAVSLSSSSKSPQVNTSLHSMSDSRDTLSPDSGVASVDTKLVTYEEAISAYSHRGENLIAKELREQKEREEELRKRWNDMGVQSPLAPQEPDTPYNMPEPQQPKPIPGHPNMVTSSKTQVSLTNGTSQGAFSNGHSSKGPGGYYHQGIKSYMEPQPNSVRRGSVDSDKSHSSSDGPVKSKVYAGEDEEDGHSYSYVPRDETPIEREIRLAREREEELRAQKGLSPRGSATDRSDMLMEMKVDVPRKPQTLERGQMKHFSSGRLQYEIQKEKQRELSMQREGKVLTLSEERAETKKYMDVIDKDNLNAPAPSPMKSPTATNAPRQTAYMRSPSMPIYNHPSYHTSASGKSEMGDRKISAPGSLAQAAAPVENGADDTHVARSPEPEVYNKPVVRSVSHQSKLSTNASNTAELKIEAELREMREREEELR